MQKGNTYILRVCDKKIMLATFYILSLIYNHLRLLQNKRRKVTKEALLYFDKTQNVNVNVYLLISARRLTSTAQNN